MPTPGQRLPMDFRSLRYFVCVAESRSFSKAADLLFVAQPALSRAVRKLEDELGAKLFVRTSAGVELTEAGSLLLQRARTLLRQLTQAADDVRAQGSSISGTVTLGLPPVTGEILVPTLVRRAAELLPGIRLRVVEGFSAYVYERLVNQELGLALLHSPVPHQSLAIEPLLVEPMHLVGPPRRRSGPRPATARLALDGLPLILPGPAHRLRLMLERALAERGIRRGPVIEVEGLATTKALIAAGLGYSLFLYGAVHREVADRRLSAVPMRDLGIDWTLSIVHRSEQHGMRALAAVRTLVRTEVRRLVDAGDWPGDPRHAGAGDGDPASP